LAHIKHEPSHAHAAANMLVDRIKGAFRHRSPPNWLHTVELSVPLAEHHASCCCVPSRSDRSVRQRPRVQGWASALARLRLFRPGGQAAWRNALERGTGIADEVANCPAGTISPEPTNAPTSSSG
jgi:hypothetical protein